MEIVDSVFVPGPGRFDFSLSSANRNPLMPTHAELVDALRWKKFPVLDDGFICLVDAMGDDQSVVQAARVSYGAGTKRVSDDRTLIRYLMRHRHSTPFEMAEIKLLVRVPMDCWRQWIRHRTANVNEYSTRYSIAIDAAQRTPPDAWRSQSPNNRQGSGDALDLERGERLTATEAEFQDRSRRLYDERIEMGVAREQARKDLPLSTYTEAYWKNDLHNLLGFLALRMDDHAQWEIREYARTIAENVVRPLFPLVWEAFADYRLGGMFLSRLDREVIARMIERRGGADPGRFTEEDFLAAQDASWTSLKRCRERDECREKHCRNLPFRRPGVRGRMWGSEALRVDRPAGQTHLHGLRAAGVRRRPERLRAGDPRHRSRSARGLHRHVLERPRPSLAPKPARHEHPAGNRSSRRLQSRPRERPE